MSGDIALPKYGRKRPTPYSRSACRDLTPDGVSCNSVLFLLNEPPRPKGQGILLSVSPSPLPVPMARLPVALATQTGQTGLPSPVKGEGVLYFTHAAGVFQSRFRNLPCSNNPNVRWERLSSRDNGCIVSFSPRLRFPDTLQTGLTSRYFYGILIKRT